MGHLAQAMFSNRPFSNRPFSNRPFNNRPFTVQQPTVQQPTVQQPTVQQPTVQQPLLPKSPVTQSPPATSKLGRFVFVPREQMGRLEQQVVGLLGNRLRAERSGNRRLYRFVPSIAGAAAVEIEFDHVRSGVLLGGPAKTVMQLVVMLETLGEVTREPGMRAQVFRVDRKNHQALRSLIVTPAETSAPAPEPGARPAPGDSGSLPIDAGGIRPVAYLQQPGGKAGEGDGPATALGNPQVMPRQFEGVEIESLPDLDVIILRGRDDDLKQLAGIIQQLERISQQTQPEIRIYRLKHTQSESLATLVNAASADLVAGRAGKVAVTPLGKPNALLLIGWGEAVKAVVELIQQLDQPVPANTQSAVFRLKYASAASIQQTLNTFFATRNGLGPRVLSTVDARTNALIVYAAPRDLTEVRRIIDNLDRPGSAAVNRARVFRVEHSLAVDVAATLQAAIEAASGGEAMSSILELQTFDAEGQKILRSGTLENVKITPNPRNNTIIISSPEANLALIEALIRQLDTPAAQVQIKVFKILNGDASSLVQTFRSLLPSQAGASVGPQLPGAEGEQSLAPLRFSVDVRSNSVIATGSEGDLRIVEALLIKLDQSNSQQRKTTVYQLKNAPAVDVASAVNQFLVSRRQVNQALPGGESPFLELEREVVVVPEPIGNKLVLSATPRFYDEINDLIEKLDEQPPQVMIQVLIAEVALNNADEFGVELGLQDTVLFDRSLLGELVTTTSSNQTSTPSGIVTATEELIQAATNLPGFGFNSILPLGNSGSTASQSGSPLVGGQGLSNFSVGRGNDQLGFGGLVLSASSRNVSVLLRALQESRRVDILSRPQIRTLDNQPAYIQVGQRVPRIIGSAVNQNGQSNSVTLENVGLIMAVTPRISPEGNVVMEIDAEKSSLGPEQDGVPVAVSIDGTVVRSPRIDTTTAQATVSAANGETIVLGGLITKQSEEFHRQVPLLGDLPLLGKLFRYDGMQTKRTELLIILTPRIIRSSEDSELIRQTELARMNWCAADVFELHGDIGFSADRQLDEVEQGQPEVIIPDENPSGEPLPRP